METLIVESGSRSKMEALKAFLAALKMDFRVEPKRKKHASVEGMITNPETIRRIEEFEAGRVKTIPMTVEELKQQYGS